MHVRCSLLRPEPAPRARLAEIRDNLIARNAEAGTEGRLDVAHIRAWAERESPGATRTSGVSSAVFSPDGHTLADPTSPDHMRNALPGRS